MTFRKPAGTASFSAENPPAELTVTIVTTATPANIMTACSTFIHATPVMPPNMAVTMNTAVISQVMVFASTPISGASIDAAAEAWVE